jgi:hypothetical protein
VEHSQGRVPLATLRPRIPERRTMKAWLPQVGICLLLQGGIAVTGLLLHHWLLAPTPCCDRHLVL